MKHCYLLQIVTVLSFTVFSVYAQTDSAAQWYKGEGSARGKDMEKIRREALKNAEANALKKAGIEVAAGTLLFKSEENSRLVDFFSEFAESNARGLILDERNVRFDDPVPLDSTHTVYKRTAHTEVLVGMPEGKPDPAFEVTMSTERETYKEYEPVFVHLKTTASGYLTILDIHGDSINVLFPNAIDQKNFLVANTDFIFPPSKAYSLEFETEKGLPTSSDIIIAVVTKDNIPFPNIERLDFSGSQLTVAEKALSTYAQWLYKIPLDKRSTNYKHIRVQRSN